jgi:hypothetical protein
MENNNIKIGYVKGVPFPNTYMLTVNDKPLVFHDFINNYKLDEEFFMKKIKQTNWSVYGCDYKNIPCYALIAWDEESLEKLTDLFESVSIAYKLK